MRLKKHEIDILLNMTSDIFNCTDIDFYHQWWPVLFQVAEKFNTGEIADFKTGLLEFDYPSHLPNLTKDFSDRCEKLHDDLSLYFHKYKEKIKMLCKLFVEGERKPLICDHRYIAFPDGTVLKFD
jgi:hypothetical protein